MKIVIIGVGSHVFAPGVIMDFMTEIDTEGCTLALVDLDSNNLELMKSYAERLALDEGRSVMIETSMDWQQVLPGADYVISCAAIQGHRRWLMDYHFLKERKLDQGYSGECGGLSGLMYALRSIHLLMDIARSMEIYCPDALLLNVTNPLPRVTFAVNAFTKIACYGFCNAAHQGATGYELLAQTVGRRVDEIDVVTAGLNHFAWLLSIHDRRTQEDLMPGIIDYTRTSQADPDLRYLFEEYEAIGVSGASHMCDYLSKQKVRNHFTLDVAPFHGSEQVRQARVDLLSAIARGRVDWRQNGPAHAWEKPIKLIKARELKATLHMDMLNLQNRGYVSNLPESHIVEVPARIVEGLIQGVAVGHLPEKVATICRQISDTHVMLAKGAVYQDRELIKAAAKMDPSVGLVDSSTLDVMLDLQQDITGY
ncbi:hypothetical protein QEH59_00705 [Coraliomargarita sp. SDUM461004]|uniref:Glycosyl hydrolase family 4 C-terminal domain-containing protein n=1 Tax=Thalassobacterium sedimentorum TaxID=3041258 RepID=A0ABU1ADX2_9BACT|nr:hypothetical protein [Coraliomargarita sp. SDUM461004]MDQ8192924.1 hypothetical protein [Coraliomargarita sp. SDUM461004]